MSNRLYRVKTGGLMRCCLASLDEYMDSLAPNIEPLEGTTIGCRYHKDPNKAEMILQAGAWRWVGVSTIGHKVMDVPPAPVPKVEDLQVWVGAYADEKPGDPGV